MSLPSFWSQFPSRGVSQSLVPGPFQTSEFMSFPGVHQSKPRVPQLQMGYPILAGGAPVRWTLGTPSRDRDTLPPAGTGIPPPPHPERTSHEQDTLLSVRLQRFHGAELSCLATFFYNINIHFQGAGILISYHES